MKKTSAGNLPRSTERRPLTALAQAAWVEHIRPGDTVIDATAGNGLDTAYLADQVGAHGHVYAFDIQEIALKITGRQLDKNGLANRVTLVHAGHENLESHLPSDLVGNIALVCFNLGYLPSGDHAVMTRAATSLPALQAALRCIREGGVLSIMAYRGHPGGEEEAKEVDAFVSQLPTPWTCLEYLATGREDRPGPVWWLIGHRSVNSSERPSG